MAEISRNIFDEADGSTTFVDEQARTWTNSGLSIYDLTLLGDGDTADCIYSFDAAMQIANGSWTLEAWIYPVGYVADRFAVMYFGAGANTHRLQIEVLAGGYLQAYIESGSGNNAVLSSAGAVSLDTWTHVAAVRDGSAWRLYVNGVLDGSATITRTITYGSHYGSIGRCRFGSINRSFNGRIDDAVISDHAKYSANFTPDARTSTWPSLPPTYGVTPDSGSANEGSSAGFSVVTTGVANGTTLYWRRKSTSTAGVADIGWADSGSFTITSDAGAFSVPITADYLREGSEDLIVEIATDAGFTSIVATASAVTIGDVSVTVPYRGLFGFNMRIG